CGIVAREIVGRTSQLPGQPFADDEEEDEQPERQQQLQVPEVLPAKTFLYDALAYACKQILIHEGAGQYADGRRKNVIARANGREPAAEVNAVERKQRHEPNDEQSGKSVVAQALIERLQAPGEQAVDEIASQCLGD